MDDLYSKFLKSGKILVRAKQPNLGEMNRTTKTVTSEIPKPVTTIPQSSKLQPQPTVKKYSDTVAPLPSTDNIHLLDGGFAPDVKDSRLTTYVNNNYAGDDYVD